MTWQRIVIVAGFILGAVWTVVGASLLLAAWFLGELVEAFGGESVVEIILSRDFLLLLLFAAAGPVLMGGMLAWWVSLDRARSSANAGDQPREG